MFFYFLLPFRAKNPPERFPWLTIALIAINTLVYVCTSEYLITLREEVMNDWALSHSTFSIVRLFASLFLHGSIMHLVGNMLFLWIFGTAVEGRMGHLRFLLLYLAAGVAGNLLWDVVQGIIMPKIFLVGASGAIMGLAGAYIYLFPFAQISIFYAYMVGFRGRAGVANWHAQWVVLLKVGTDLFEYLLFGTTGLSPVAYLAHFGGFGVGFAIPLLARMKRDSEDFSDAQAMRADTGKNLLALSLPELQALMEGSSDNVRIIMAFCKKAAAHYSGSCYGMCHAALLEHRDLVFTEADPEHLAALLFGLPDTFAPFPAAYEMRLASRLEQEGSYEFAGRMYRRVIAENPDAPETEMALARLARLVEQTRPEKGEAAAIYAELLKRFPNGPQAPYAQNALRRLGPPTIVFSAGKGLVVEEAPPPEGLAIVQSEVLLAEKDGTADEVHVPTPLTPGPEAGVGLEEVGAPVVLPGYAASTASTEEGGTVVPAMPTLTLIPMGYTPPSESETGEEKEAPFIIPAPL